MSAADAIDEQPRIDLPLAVDLDGTLIRCDLFFEAILRLAFASPWRIPLLLGWLLRGRAYAKQRLAESRQLDAALLPYDERVLDWLRQEDGRGRTLVLATASDRRAAQIVADHVGVFDLVFASDGATNLKAARKAERLAQAFPDGFVYAGNEGADMAVWGRAARAVVANASPAIERAAERSFEIEKTFAREGGGASALLQAMRPQHWLKNLLVFAPMLAGQGWDEPVAWAGALLAFAALSLVASGVYLVNDAADIDADRRHPRKRARPFASGALSPAWGLGAAGVLVGLGLVLADLAGVLPLTILYLAATTAYTFWLKRLVLIDVFVLAGLYAIRVVIGGVAAGFPASDWLLAFSGFLFLSLALVKRAAETRDLALRAGGAVEGRGYLSSDTGALTMMGVSAGFVAALVLALYLQDDVVAANYRRPLMLWVLPGACVLWICRLWLKVARGNMDDDPILAAVRDPWSWVIAGVAALCFLAAVY
ncbi:MAG: UbiA family prenyltransferase [Vitreimonas sp.]